MEIDEKVIKGLECCLPMTTRYGYADCKHCPYDRKITLEGGICECCHELMMDALGLVKGQEAVKPIKHYVPDGKRSSVAWQCGGCLIDIGYGVNYCYNCGRAVKWNDNTAND